MCITNPAVSHHYGPSEFVQLMLACFPALSGNVFQPTADSRVFPLLTQISPAIILAYRYNILEYGVKQQSNN